MQAMKERDDELPLSGFIQLDDAYWAASKKENEAELPVIKALLLLLSS